MKHILLISYIFLTSLSQVVAQAVNFKKGDYVKDPELDKFEGIWTWEDEKFQLVLKKEKFYYKQLEVYADVITGEPVYTKDRKKVASRSSVLKLGEPVLMGWATADSLLTISLYDAGKEKNVNASLRLLPGGNARWELSDTEGIRLGERLPGFSYPEELILERKK